MMMDILRKFCTVAFTAKKQLFIHDFVCYVAPRKPVGSGIKPAVSSRIQSRPTGVSKISSGVSKTTPTTKQVKSASKAVPGKSSGGSAASAAEIKALNEEITRLQDQVRLGCLMIAMQDI